MARVLIATFSLLLFALPSGSILGQRITGPERQGIKEFRGQIDQAGKRFKARKIPESVSAFNEARQKLAELAAGARPELAKALKTEYGRLEKTHRLLSEADQELTALPTFEELLQPAAETISFQQQVAPIIVAKCGNCHVNQSRGRFSAASFDALEKSTTIAFGIPKDSRLIQVIESGEMPKGGLTVSPEELEILKSWILQGAKFDGEDRTRNLNQLVNAEQPEMTPGLEVAKPTGNESVSFGLQIAPILVENCARCHMVDNPQGNFFQATFESFLRGGDSGAPIKPGDAAGSLLYRRIAAGEMPPSGRLPEKSIELIKTWIDEGATFDGLDAGVTLVAVAKTAKAESQSHKELLQDRSELSLNHWELVMDKAVPIQVSSQNFNLFSATDEARSKLLSELLEKLAPEVAGYFKADPKLPLVKGNTSVFLFEKRYDFSEFGKMISRQELPRQLNYFWDFNITDCFASILLTRDQALEEAEILLVQQLGAIYLASLAPDVPRWFADGTGYWVAAKHAPRHEQVQAWESAALEAAQSVKTPADLLDGRLGTLESGLAGYQVIKVLKKKSSTFDRMLDRLRDGESFETAFEAAYGASLRDYLTRGW